MTVSELYQYLNISLNKDTSGNSLSPKELNIYLESEIFNFVKENVFAYRQFVNTGAPLDDVILSGLLFDALQKKTTATLSSGYFTVPTDMFFMNDIYGTYNSAQKKIELVSPEEVSRRTANLLAKPIAYYPVAYIVGTSCYVFPTTMTGINVNYIAKPTIPVYDYYVDANYKIQYLAASATRLLTAGEYGSAGQTSGTTVTSLTTELDIPEDSHMAFANYLLGKIAIRDRDQLMYQAAENEKSKQ